MKTGTKIYSTRCTKCDSTRVQCEKALGADRWHVCHRGHLYRATLVETFAGAGWLHFMYTESAAHAAKLAAENAASGTLPAAIEMPAAPETSDPSIHWRSLDGTKTAREYQRTGAEFIESARLCGIIADEMGLGKTIQAALLLRRNRTIMFPALILVPAQVIYQWAGELRQWAANGFADVMPVASRDQIFPGYGIYIMSMDLLGRKGVAEKVAACGIKAIIIDECHRLKDRDAQRTKAVRKFCDDNGIQYRIGLSGTPLKNRVSEFWSTFDLVRPRQFGSYSDFCSWYLVKNEKGVYVRLNPRMEEAFTAQTAKFLIRRKKADVLTDLPAITRDFQIIEIEDANIRGTYNRTVNLFQSFLADNKSGINSQAMLGWLAKLRQLTGNAKIPNAVEWAVDFLESTEESLIIGTLHDTVRDALYYTLQMRGITAEKLSGENNAWEKEKIVKKFRNGESRLLVMNMKAGGEGLNLQTASNILVIERMWNSADEEQVEARIHRMGQEKPCTATYMIAKGTIDEFMHNLILAKKTDIGTGYGESVDVTGDSLESLLEFSQFVAGKTI